MFGRALSSVLLILMAGSLLRAGDIEGTVVIERKLTKTKSDFVHRPLPKRPGCGTRLRPGTRPSGI